MGVRTCFVIGTLAMAFGFLSAQVPIPRHDPNVPTVVAWLMAIFATALGFLMIPMVYLSRIARKRSDLIIFLGLSLVGVQILICLWVIADALWLLRQGEFGI